MRRHALTLLLSLLLVPSLAETARAQTADTVVDKYLAAIGGRDSMSKLTSRRSTGTVTISTPGGDVSGPIEILLKSPNKSRAYMSLDLSAAGGGQVTIEQKFDGTTGYAVNSMQGEIEMSANQLDNLRNNVFPSPLLNYKDTGLKIEVLPGVKIGGKDTVGLQVTPKAGSAIKMFFDPETYLLLRTVSTVNSPQMGGDIEQTSDFSDYRDVDGVKVPFHVVNSNPVQSLTIALTKVEHNVPIDDAVFAKK